MTKFRRSWYKSSLPTATSLLLASCGFVEAERSGNFARDAYVLVLGSDPSFIRECAGEPTRITPTATGEVWRYVYPWSQYEPTDIWYEGYLDFYFEDSEVVDVRPSANRTRDSIGFPLGENTIATMSEPVIRGCVT